MRSCVPACARQFLNERSRMLGFLNCLEELLSPPRKASFCCHKGISKFLFGSRHFLCRTPSPPQLTPRKMCNTELRFFLVNDKYSMDAAEVCLRADGLTFPSCYEEPTPVHTIVLMAYRRGVGWGMCSTELFPQNTM